MRSERSLGRGRLSAAAALWLLVAATGTPAVLGGRVAAAREANSPRRADTADARLSPAAALRALDGMPLAFVENRGQADRAVHYQAHGPGYAFHMTREALVISLAPSRAAAAQGAGAAGAGLALALRFVGAHAEPRIEGEQELPGRRNYFLGGDAAAWRTSLRAFARVRYRDVWPGIDMVVSGTAGELKYEFRVRPGACADQIRLAYDGATRLTVSGSGSLDVHTPAGVVTDAAPVSYQEIDGARVEVPSRFALHGDAGAGREYGFALGSYRTDRELVIDPAVAYATFLGGASHDVGAGVTTDAGGNVYVIGWTQSTNLPTVTGAFDRTFNGGVVDVYVAKLDPSGSRLIYATYLGGTPAQVPAGGSDPFEFGRAIAVDASGNAYVTGQTTSANFPTTAGAFDRTLNVSTFDTTDAFVAKLNTSGSSLLYSTFLGGTDYDDGRAIAVDGAGNAYVAGQTASGNFPTSAAAFDRTRAGGYDAFVVKLNPAGSALAYSTYLGGADNEIANRIAVDAAGSAYVAGGTRSSDFPATAGAFDPTHNGGAFDALFDGFVTKLNAAGSALVYSTFIGGSQIDSIDGLAIDASGRAYVAGGTLSPDFPATPGAFRTAAAAADSSPSGVSDGFAAKLNAAGASLEYATFLGGGHAAALAVDRQGRAWIAGATDSAAFPATPDAAATQFNGGPSDAVVMRLDAAGTLFEYATFLGGTGAEHAAGVALDADGNAHVTGTTYSSDFLTTAQAFDRTFAGDPFIFWGDAFIVKLTGGTGSPPPPPGPPELASLGVTPSSVTGGATSQGTVTLTAPAPAGGLAVSLASDRGAATVSASVTVPGGAVSQTFGIGTTPVSTVTSATISAAAGAVVRSAVLTVSPAAQPATATLSVTATGRSGQRITSSPSGINVAVGSTGSAAFATGTSITLSVSNGRDAVWSGACSSGGARRRTCRFTLTGPASVTANVR